FLPEQPAFGGGDCGFFGSPFPCTDAFLAKMNPTGSALFYSTYLGGSKDDSGSAVAFDPAGNAYVTGSTNSTDFPTANAFQATLNTTGFSPQDAFVTKVNTTGSAILFSTYLGGSGSDTGKGIAVDATGNATVVGTTSSKDFPLVKPLQCYNNGDAFVTRFTGAGSALNYSTYLGGSNSESGNAVALDGNGNAYLTGYTYSSDFP